DDLLSPSSRPSRRRSSSCPRCATMPCKVQLTLSSPLGHEHAAVLRSGASPCSGSRTCRGLVMVFSWSTVHEVTERSFPPLVGRRGRGLAAAGREKKPADGPH